MEKIMNIMSFLVVYSLVIIGLYQVSKSLLFMAGAATKKTKEEGGKGIPVYAGLAIAIIVILILIVANAAPTFFAITPGLS